VIANEYELPVFVVDLSILESNSQLQELVTEINYRAQDKRHALVFEDVDRSKMFEKRHWRQNKITMDCFLNVLDGIVESYGRLLFLTANCIDELRAVESNALIRPGRIDRVVQILPCDADQVQRMMQHFYDEEIGDVKLGASVTAAQVVQLMQENPTDVSAVREKIASGEAQKVAVQEGRWAGTSMRARTSDSITRARNVLVRNRRKLKRAEYAAEALEKLREKTRASEEKLNQAKRRKSVQLARERARAKAEVAKAKAAKAKGAKAKGAKAKGAKAKGAKAKGAKAKAVKAKGARAKAAAVHVRT